MAEEGDAAAVAAAAAAKPWYDGFDAETLGHLQNRGWDKKSAPEVVREAVQSWKAAEKLVGIPADQVLRVPKEASDEKGWNALWARLGKPADAKGYDFSAIKYADGSAPEDGFIEAMRQTAYRMHVPKDAAAEMTREVVKYQESADKTKAADKTAKLVEQKAALKTNWGANEAANMFVAQRAAAALGIDPATVSALEGVIGYDKIMEMFRSIGSKIGEDKFITGTQQGGVGGVMTREQALARKAELMADKVWVKSYLDKDAAKVREMTALNTIIVGNQQAA